MPLAFLHFAYILNTRLEHFGSDFVLSSQYFYEFSVKYMTDNLEQGLLAVPGLDEEKVSTEGSTRPSLGQRSLAPTAV